MELPLKIVIPNFINTVEIAVRKEIYYHKNDTNLIDGCFFDKKGFLRDKQDKKLIIKKVTKVKKSFSINANRVLFSNGTSHTTAILNAIKKSFTPYLQNLSKIEDYPIRVKLYVYDTPSKNSNTYDIGNISYLYGKAFLDLLSKGFKMSGINLKPIILDDNVNYVTEDPQGGVFCPIEDGGNRRLLFLIAKDDDTFLEIQKDIEKNRQQLIKKWKKLEQ